MLDVGFSYRLLRGQGCLPREVLAAANRLGQVPVFDRFLFNSSAQVIEPRPERHRESLRLRQLQTGRHH